MVGQGFADGIDDSAAGVDAAVARMMSIPAQPGRPGAMGGKLGGVGGISMPINISINGGSATAEEIADMAIDKFKDAAPGVLAVCGAGISTPADVKKAIELGADGVLVASAYVKAKNPRQLLEEMARQI